MTNQIVRHVHYILNNLTDADTTNLTEHMKEISDTKKLPIENAFLLIHKVLYKYEWAYMLLLSEDDLTSLHQEGVVYDLGDIEDIVKCYNNYDACQLGVMFSGV